jgi:organic hydroperoxide reductase OsmC/OhrA
MSEFSAQVTWTRGDEHFTDNHYSRGHLWSFDGGATVAASSSPEVVPLPYSVPENVDPEEAFVAALSSCHMLFFLSLAAKAGFVVDSYADRAVGLMSSVDGVTQVTEVSLNPRIGYSGARPGRDVEMDLHDQAHARCFLANSVKSRIKINTSD